MVQLRTFWWPWGWGHPSKTPSSCAPRFSIPLLFSPGLGSQTWGLQLLVAFQFKVLKVCTFHSIPNRAAEETDIRKVGITAFLPKFRSTITTMSYRKKCFNVLMNEGGNVLPVQNISQPAVLTINMHLVPFVPSRVCHVLWNKAGDMPNLNASKRLMSLLFDTCLYTFQQVLTYLSY